MTASADRRWIVLDGALRVGIQQTLRVPEAGGPFPLPPALGRLPVRAAADYPALASEESSNAADFIVAMHPREAVWLQFIGNHRDPRAVEIAVGGINALTGLAWNLGLESSPQNYIVCPYQPWLDGFNVGDGLVRQFVAVPLHTGLTVEHQLTGQDQGGMTVACYRPKKPIAVDRAHPRRADSTRELGIGAGAQIRQRIYPDPYGLDTWEPLPASVTRIRLIDAAEFTRLTGEEVPPSAIDAATYLRFGLPWFEVYDAARGQVPTTPTLAGIKSVGTLAGEDTAEDETPTETPANIRPIPPRSRKQE